MWMMKQSCMIVAVAALCAATCLGAIDLNGFLFVEFPTEMPLEKCMEILRRMFRGRPITPARLWWVTNNGVLVDAIAREEARHE